MKEDPPSTFRTRASLLVRARNLDDAVAWEEFYRLYRRLIFGFACRRGLSATDADDVTQDVFRRVAATIHEFDTDPNRGSFRGWLMNLTRWRIADKFSDKPPPERQLPSRSEPGEARTATVERVPDEAGFEEAWNREWQQHLLDAALDRLSRRAKPRHFQAFDLYVRQNWPVTQVAARLGINAARVYLIGHRLTRELKAEVARLQKQWD